MNKEGGKNIPQLRFPEFDTEWENKKLGENCSILMCKRIFTQQTNERGEIPFYKIGTLGNKPNAFISRELFEEYKSKYNYPKKGETLITCSGTVGKCIQFDGNDSYYQDSNIVWIDNSDGELLNDFLFYLLSNFDWGKLNSTTITRIYTNDLRNIQLRYPNTLPEQQKIASFLSAVDDKIRQLTRKKELLEQYKKGVMQKIFKQEIRFKREDGRNYPDWEIKRAKEVFRNHSNKNHNGDLPILAASQERGMVFRNSIDIQITSSEASVKSYKVVEKGDFVISLRSFQGGIEYSYLHGICSPAYTILKPRIKIVDEFFRYYFKKDDFIERLSKTIIGIRDGKQITYENFGWLKLNIPSIEEQHKISDFLNSLDKKIEQITLQLEKTREFKKGLLKQMFV